MGSIAQVWDWLIHLPALGIILLLALIAGILAAGAWVYDAWAQYNRR